jgi:hypothetical protein
MSYPAQEDQRLISQPSPGHIAGAGPGGMQYGGVSSGGRPTDGYPYPSTGPANMKSLDGIQDFTPDQKHVEFRIGQDVFHGVQDVPALMMMRYAAKIETIDENNIDEDDVELISDLMRLLLVPESANLLLRRMEDQTNPISIETYMTILPWLLEQYGMRPTEPSSGSADGSPPPDDGQKSTESSVEAVSTSSPSPSPVP